VEFFKQARALGDYLIVSFASDAVLAGHKQGRRSSIPTEHKKALIGSLRMVDEVVVGEGHKAGQRRFVFARLLVWMVGRHVGGCSTCSSSRMTEQYNRACQVLAGQQSHVVLQRCQHTVSGAKAAASPQGCRQAGTAACLLQNRKLFSMLHLFVVPAGLDFEEHFLRIRPQLLVVTEDDKYGQLKRDLCAQVCHQTARVDT
jgi:hypothetical protein